MTAEQLKRAIELKAEIKILEEGADYFDYENHSYLGINDKQKANETIKREKFPFWLKGFIKKDEKTGEEKNMARLVTKGFTGNKAIEFNTELVDICRKYYKDKLAEKRKEFEEL